MTTNPTPPATTDAQGYALSAEEGRHRWFLDTRMTVQAGGPQTGGAFTLVEWAAPVGFGPPRHIHHREDEAFYLVDGALDVECGDQRWSVGPGGFVLLPRGIPHAFVVTAGPVRGLQITSPAGFEDYLEELSRPAGSRELPTPSAPDVEALVAASERYGMELVGPPMGGGPPHHTG